MAAESISVWIDDRHPIFRRGLRTCLRADGVNVAGESAGFDPLPPGRVDVVIFEADGVGLQRALQLRLESGFRLVAVVASPDDRVLYDAVDAGVSALHLRQDMGPESLLASVRAAVNDNATLPHDLLPRLLKRAARTGHAAPSKLHPRELAVLQHLAEGDDTRHIAGELSYSERTVKNIVHDVLMKLNCRNRAHAVAMATRRGII